MCFPGHRSRKKLGCNICHTFLEAEALNNELKAKALYTVNLSLPGPGQFTWTRVSYLCWIYLGQDSWPGPGKVACAWTRISYLCVVYLGQGRYLCCWHKNKTNGETGSRLWYSDTLYSTVTNWRRQVACNTVTVAKSVVINSRWSEQTTSYVNFLATTTLYHSVTHSNAVIPCKVAPCNAIQW